MFARNVIFILQQFDILFLQSEGVTHSLECPLCLAELTPDEFCELSGCGHRACIPCLQQYLRVEITESRVAISCPECLEPMHPNGTIKQIEIITNRNNIGKIVLQKFAVF